MFRLVSFAFSVYISEKERIGASMGKDAPVFLKIKSEFYLKEPAHLLCWFFF